MEIEIGDLVKLKSGSPIMTVNSRIKGNEYMCVYFDSDGNAKSIILDSKTLIKVSSNETNKTHQE
jgi:uncharacterized protein YodC (DUF2158 family)